MDAYLTDEFYPQASEEARRLYEKYFSTNFPYTIIIEGDENIPYYLQERYYQLVEDILYYEKGESIHRKGNLFKIDKYQKR